MKTSDFNFDLPAQLIAQYPLQQRSASRLLKVDASEHGKQQLSDLHFRDIIDLVHPDDLLVFNNTRVIPARLYGRKETGGKVEVLLERIVSGTQAWAQIKSSKSPKVGSLLRLGAEYQQQAFAVRVCDRKADLFLLQLEQLGDFLQLCEEYGHVPLPPYVKREDEDCDLERYQTVYASEKGAVAAPTAGLHFDRQILEQLKAKGVRQAFITLHVGAGTYQPVRVENIQDHKMHQEYIHIDQAAVKQIQTTRKRGGRVIAVGTTALRTLESAAQFSQAGTLSPYQGETDIFIYPGYQFQLVDALITNFHLPESTLFMLVSAFCGLDNMKRAYRHAIAQGYRFFSYGDAMFLLPQTDNSHNL